MSEVDNVTALLAEEAFRGFNFGSKFELAEFPAEVKNKVAETSGQFLLSYASPKMIDMFRANPTIISIHGSSGTNSSKFVLISILIFGKTIPPVCFITNGSFVETIWYSI